jgi:hypothetical protein
MILAKMQHLIMILAENPFELSTNGTTIISPKSLSNVTKLIIVMN